MISVSDVNWTRTSFKWTEIGSILVPAKMLFFQFGIWVWLVSQCCSLVAAGSNGHCSTPMLYRLPALVLLLLWVFVRFFKICQLFKKKLEGGLMVDVFLRICSKVQRQMEDLCVSNYIQLFRLQSNHEGAGVFINKREVFPRWNPHDGQQLDPVGWADLSPLALLLDYSHLCFLMNSEWSYPNWVKGVRSYSTFTVNSPNNISQHSVHN